VTRGREVARAWPREDSRRRFRIVTQVTLDGVFAAVWNHLEELPAKTSLVTE
jgi:hypothetical protein